MRFGLLITSTLKGILWFAFRAIYLVTRDMLWRIRGIKQHANRNEDTKAYSETVHVQNILFRYKLDEVVQSANINNFLTVHHSFRDPNYLLKNNITLYSITRTEAVFIESNPDVDVTSSKHSSFLRIAQFRLAKKLIIVPMHVFHKVANEIGDPPKKLIFLANTSRCGSTLLTQIFEETGHIMALSEPDAMYNITCLKEQLPKAELENLIRSSMRMVCKNARPETHAFVVKLSQPTISLTPVILDLFPQSKNLFMYRNGLKVARSVCKLVRSVPQLEFLLGLMEYPWFLDAAQAFVKIFGVPLNGVEQLPNSLCPIHIGTSVWAISIAHYLKFRENDYKIAAVRYEDIMENPTFAIQRIFDYCELEYDIEKTCCVFERDSQENSPLSRASLRAFNGKDAVSPELMELLDTWCHRQGAPSLGDYCVIDGTITHKPSNGFHKNGGANGCVSNSFNKFSKSFATAH